MPLVLIISLHKERYDAIVKKYRKIGGVFQTIHVPGVLVTTKQRNENCSKICRFLCSDSLVGCSLAHQTAWSLALKYNDDVFIYEDDIEFHSHFNEQQALHLLKQTDFVALGNMISGHKNISLIDHLLHITQTGTLIDISQTNSYNIKWLNGTHGYLISPQCAQKLCNLLKTINGHIDREISNLFIKHKLNGIGIRPSMVSQAQFSQSTQSQSQSKDQIDNPGIAYKLNFTCLQIGKVKFSNLQIILLIVLCLLCFPIGIIYFLCCYYISKRKHIIFEQ